MKRETRSRGSRLEDHPTVKMLRSSPRPGPSPLDAAELRRIALDAGADDVGFVEIDRPEIAEEREHALRYFPAAKTFVSLVVRMNREPIRNPARSIANLEFHHVGDEVNEVARRLVAALEERGVRAVNPAMGFPMEMDHFPDRIWVVSHKPVAEAAGLGVMGIHRSLIHPRFGSFVLLGTVLVDAALEERGEPLDYNPCVECKLCVAACPVGAIGSDGAFDFSSCYTHNYREFMGGFTDWVETVADSKGAKQYRKKVTDGESASVWQSLSFGANYKAAYCLAVCPAGSDVMTPFLDDRKAFVGDFLKPLQAKEEPVYVVPGSDAEAHVAQRFPHKTARQVRGSLRPASIRGFLSGMRLTFQRGQAEGVDAVYHFRFTGEERRDATVVIRDQRLEVREGHHGDPDFRLTADGAAWLSFLRKDLPLAVALLARKIRFRGSPKRLLEFSRCFPS